MVMQQDEQNTMLIW